MNGRCIEIVTFKVRPGVTRESLLAAARRANRFLERCEGFLDRELSVTEAGEYVDMVHWRDTATAQRAAAAFNRAAECAEFIAMIDTDSVTARHSAPLERFALPLT